MKKRLNADQMNVNGKTVNVGIDVHKVSWHVTALVEGIVVESATINPSYRVLKKLLAPYIRVPGFVLPTRQVLADSTCMTSL